MSREIYASWVKKFALYGSTKYPPTEWSYIGIFEAEGPDQTFELKQVWLRYIRIVLIEWQGDEHTCTLN